MTRTGRRGTKAVAAAAALALLVGTGIAGATTTRGVGHAGAADRTPLGIASGNRFAVVRGATGGMVALARPAAIGHNAPTPGKMTYHGGPVQTAPKLYVVFWDWKSDPDGIRPYLLKFYADTSGSSWLSVVHQYSGAAKTAPVLEKSWSDTASVAVKPSKAQVQAEAVRAAKHFGLKNVASGVNDQIIVALPKGHDSTGFGPPKGYCAYHGWLKNMSDLTYTDLPYMTDGGGFCGIDAIDSSRIDGVSFLAGHELAESITDPYLNAWYDSTGQEISDKCQWYDNADITANGVTFPVQPLWSNSASACVITPPGRWSTDAIQSTGISEDVALASAGNQEYAVYNFGTDVLWSIWNQGTWSAAQAVEYPSQTVQATGPPAVTFANGKLYVAWTDLTTGDVEVSYLQNQSTDVWSVPVIVGNGGAKSSAGPSMCTTSGVLFVAFKGLSSTNAYYSASSDGVTWTTESQATDANTPYTPGIACLPSGVALIGWTTSTGLLQYQTTLLGIWSRLETIPGLSNLGPAFAVVAGGEPWSRIYASWKGTSAGTVYYSSIPTATPITTSRWKHEATVPGSKTQATPGIAAFGLRIYESWTNTVSGDLMESHADEP